MFSSLLRSLALLVMVIATTTATSAATTLNPGNAVPAFNYQLLNGHVLKNEALLGHPYVLWLVASWCPSCQAGSTTVADHLALLREHGVRVVELRLAHDLGAPGPGLQAFQKAVGPRSNDPNWFWGEASEAQTLALDPKGYPDIYYLVDAPGSIVAVSGNPGGSWDTIAHFATSTVATK